MLFQKKRGMSSCACFDETILYEFMLIFGVFVLKILTEYLAAFSSENMEYISIKEAAEKWDISVRRVQTICNEGMIQDVIKFCHAWAIPK